MARYGRSGWLRRPAVPRALRVAVAPLLVAALGAWPVATRAQQAAESKGKASKPSEVMQGISALNEAQRSLAVTLSELRDQLTELQGSVGEGHDAMRQNHDAVQAAMEQIKGMREEVRGLYVESSGLKGDIAQLGEQVEGLDDSLASFRLSAGIVVAVVIVLQLALVGLMFRARG